MTLPPLPAPEHEGHVDARFKRHNCYTAEQMQAYGKACLESEQAQPGREPLSDDEIQKAYLKAYKEGVHGRNLEKAFARAIEAAHGIKGGQQ